MQKSNDIGSILLWSICISLVLVFLFASFSTKLSEKIRFEKSLVWVVETIFLEDSLTEWTWVGEGNSLERIVQNSFTLQQGKSTEFRYISTYQVPLSITIQKGGPLFFKFVAFSWATFVGGVTASGFIDSSISFTWNLSTQYNQWILYIKNLWGYTSFYLSGGMNYEQETQEYKAIKIIGGDEKTQKIITERQFSPWDWGEVDYTWLNMEF